MIMKKNKQKLSIIYQTGLSIFILILLGFSPVWAASSVSQPGPWTTSGTDFSKEWVLTGDPKSGGYEFDIKGLDNSSWSSVVKDVYTLASVFDGTEIDNAGNPYHISVWIFGPNWFPDYHGKYRLRVNMHNLSGSDSDPKAYEQDTRIFNWDPDKTYHVKVIWQNHKITLYIDGQEEQGWNYSGIDEEFTPKETVFRIGSMHWGSGPNVTYSNVKAWIGSESTKSGDLNSDGKVDIIDLGILLSNWGSTAKPPADLNQDGYVDIIDLGIMLSNWS